MNEDDKLKYWNKSRKRIIIIETVILIITALIILSGLICDALCIDVGVCKNIDGLSLTILQIQATLTTLVIAVVALLSGSISDSYMGISVSSYYMDIRPYILKWKIVTISEFSLLGINVIFHIFSFNTLVVSVFVVSLLALVVYTLEIYTVFKGRNYSLSEIKEYIEWRFATDHQYDKNGKQFVTDWKAVILDQSTDDYNEYLNLFMFMVFQIIEQGQNFKLVDSFTEEIALTLLEDESQANRVKGIKFVEEYYKRVMKWVETNSEVAFHMTDQIHLIDHIAHEWYVAVMSFDSETIEREVRLKTLAKYVIRTAACLGFDEDKSHSEPNAIYSIARSWGSILDKQVKKSSYIDKRFWESELFGHFDYHAFGIPEATTDFLQNSYALYDFFVCYGYLLKGKTDIVKNAIFLDDIGNQFKIEYRALLYRFLLIHCFVYYLGFRESTECVDESIKQLSYDLITDENVIHSVVHFCYMLADEMDLLSADLEENMEVLLRHYELFPKHSNGKAIIIEEIVKEYFLFISLLVFVHSYKRDKLIGILDANKYYTYLFDYKKNDIISKFIELESLFNSNDTDDESRKKRAEDLYGIFTSVVNEKYKKEIITKAAKNQREFEENQVKEITEEKIKRIITEKFISVFGKVNALLPTKSYKKIRVMSSLDYTGFLGENLRDAYSDYPFANFMIWLAKELRKTFEVEAVNRDERFESDAEFRSYLASEHFNLLIGSSYAFCCANHNDYKQHNDFLNSCDTVYIPTTGFGIATNHNNLCVRLDDVIVDIYSPTIDEIDAIKNADTGLYEYSPMSGLKLDFEESELREYIHDERKIIRVYFSVSIGVKEIEEHNSCVIISRND